MDEETQRIETRGRPLGKDYPVTLKVRVDEEMAAWLKDQGNRSQAIREAVARYRKSVERRRPLTEKMRELK